MQVLPTANPSTIADSSTASTTSESISTNCTMSSPPNRKQEVPLSYYSASTNTLTSATTAPSTIGTSSYRRECSNDTHFTSSEPSRQTTQSSDALSAQVRSASDLGNCINKKREREQHGVEEVGKNGSQTKCVRDEDELSPTLPPRQDSYYSATGSNNTPEKLNLKSSYEELQAGVGSRQTSTSSACFDTAVSYHQRLIAKDWPLPSRYSILAHSAATSCSMFESTANPRIKALDEKRKRRLLRKYYPTADSEDSNKADWISSGEEWSDEELEAIVLDYDAEQTGGEEPEDTDDVNPNTKASASPPGSHCEDETDNTESEKNEDENIIKDDHQTSNSQMPLDIINSICEVNVEKLTIFSTAAQDNYNELQSKWGIFCKRMEPQVSQRLKLQWACRNLGYLCYFGELKGQKKRLTKLIKQHEAINSGENAPSKDSARAASLLEEKLQIAKAQSHFSKYLVCAETIHVPLGTSAKGEESAATSNPNCPDFSSVFIVLPKRFPRTLKSFLETCPLSGCSADRQPPSLGIRMHILHQLLMAIGYLHANGFYGGCKNSVVDGLVTNSAPTSPLSSKSHPNKNTTYHNFDLICPKSILISDDYQIKIVVGGFGGADNVGSAIGGCLADVMGNDAGAHINQFETSVAIRTPMYTAPEALKLPHRNDLSIFLEKKGGCVSGHPMCKNRGLSPSIGTYGATPSPTSVSSRSESVAASTTPPATHPAQSESFAALDDKDGQTKSTDSEPILRANTAGPFEVEERKDNAKREASIAGKTITELEAHRVQPIAAPQVEMPKPFSLHPPNIQLPTEMEQQKATPPPPPHASDIWSVGCILAELITCKPLFESKSGPINALETIVELMGNTSEFVRREDIQRVLRRDLKCEKEVKVGGFPMERTASSVPSSMNRRNGGSSFNTTPVMQVSRSAPITSVSVTSDTSCGYSIPTVLPTYCTSPGPVTPSILSQSTIDSSKAPGTTPTSPTTPGGALRATSVVVKNEVKPKFMTIINNQRCYNVQQETEQHDWPQETVEKLISLEQDLLGKLLEMDAHLRPTAIEALQHPYFQDCWEFDNGEWSRSEGKQCSLSDDETQSEGQQKDVYIEMLMALSKHREEQLSLKQDLAGENDDITTAATASAEPFPFPPHLDEPSEEDNEDKARQYVWKLFCRMQQQSN